MSRIHIEAHKIARVGYNRPKTAEDNSRYIARYAAALRRLLAGNLRTVL